MRIKATAHGVCAIGVPTLSQGRGFFRFPFSFIVQVTCAPHVLDLQLWFEIVISLYFALKSLSKGYL